MKVLVVSPGSRFRILNSFYRHIWSCHKLDSKGLP